MLNELKRQFVMNWKDFPLGLGIAATGGTIFSVLLYFIAPDMRGNEVSVALGSIIFLVVAGFYSLLQTIGTIGYGMNIALKMGAIRRHYVLGGLAYSFAASLLLMLASMLWQLIDFAILAAAGVNLATVVGPSPLWALGVAFATTLLGGWGGAVVMRSYRWGVMVMVFIFAAPMWLGSIYGAGLQEGRTDLLGTISWGIHNFVSGLPVAGLYILASVAVLAVAGHTWGMLRRVAAHD